MNLTLGFVATAVVCAAPFALAVRDDLRRDDDGDALERYAEGARAAAWQDRNDHDYEPDDDDSPEPTEVARRSVTVDDLAQLIGPAPAAPGPLLSGLVLGASSESFLPDDVRARLEAYKLDHHVDIDFDYDFVSFDGITIRALGPGPELRDAIVAAWGTPRRLAEDQLVWLGAGGVRAVYDGLIDGFELTFTRYSTVAELVAPADKAKLGVEPFPLLGAGLAALEAALGSRLLETSYDDERVWSVPGVGHGAGRTTVRVSLDPARTKIIGVVVEGSTADADAVADALILKWGKPSRAPDEDGALIWKRGGVTTTVDVDEDGFTISQAR